MKSKLIKIALSTLVIASICQAETETKYYYNEKDNTISTVPPSSASATAPEMKDSSASSSKDTVNFLIGGGFIFSSDYNDSIDEAYTTYGYSDTGGFGWVDLCVALEFMVADQFSIIGGCDLWINAVEVENGSLEDSYINTIITPSIQGRFYFTKKQTWYVSGTIGLPLVNFGGDYYDADAKDIMLSGNIGYSTSNGGFRVEGGFVHLPVEIEHSASHPINPGLKGEDQNFGGIQIRVIAGF